MTEQVFFYRLSRKFVDEQFNIPEEAKAVMYYSLAIGHHLGVVDCLKAEFICSRADYQQWINKLSDGSEAKRKMAGFLQFGEVTIYREHCHMLACAFTALANSGAPLTTQEQQWTTAFMALLRALYHDPHMYLMLRSR